VTRPTRGPLVVRQTLCHASADEAGALRELRAIRKRLLRWAGWRCFCLDVLPAAGPRQGDAAAQPNDSNGGKQP
jgi:hypothetical protein